MAAPLDPYSPESLADPVAFWARLRAEAPVFEVPDSPGHFLVSRYDDVRRVCNAPELYSSEVGVIAQLGPDGRPQLTLAASAGTPHGKVLGAADGEVHDRHRRLLARTLGAREMKRFERWVHARAEALVREAPVECDAMEALAGPLPVQAMLHLLGLPTEDWRRLFAWSGPVMLLMGGRLDAETTARYVAESEALQAYLAPSSTRGRSRPRGSPTKASPRSCATPRRRASSRTGRRAGCCCSSWSAGARRPSV